MDDYEVCEVCGRTGSWYNPIQKHHVFFGRGVRPISDRYGMVAHLCYECHEGPNGVHHNRELDLELKEKYQAIFEDVVHPVGKELREELTKKAIEAYEGK